MAESLDPIRMAYAYARRLGLSEQDACDCAMDFRLHLLQKPSAHPESAAWQAQCAHNFTSNYVRAHRRRQQYEQRYSEQRYLRVVLTGEPLFDGPGPRTLFLRKALWEQIRSILRKQFTSEQYDLFLCYHVEQLSLSEISERTGRSLAALTQSLYHIHRRLGRLLIEQNLNASDARQLISSSALPSRRVRS